MPRKPQPRKSSPESEDAADHGPGERLQKVLAAAGVGSRRDCEELITAGRIEVDRKVVRELGTRVDPLKQEIRVDGEALRQPKRLYYAVNKPEGVVTTNFDPSGRSRVIDLVPTDERVFAVGRLDRSSEGLILVTNDGEFANRITHPRYGVEKTYLVRVAGAPHQQQLAKLKQGMHLAEGFAKAQSITVKKQHGQSTDLVIVLNEGRNREIRRILARVGHKVLSLRRVAVGPIKLGDLEVGAWRRLMPQEIESLLAAAQLKRKEAKQRKKESGVRSHEPKSPAKALSPKPKIEGEKQYVQKAALFAEPLSLDDLLRDDLDEGPIIGGDAGESFAAGELGTPQPRGGVIDYEGDEPAVDRPQKPLSKRPPPGRPPAKKPRSGPRRPEQQPREALPREDFGRKRGGKRAVGPPHEGRGGAGKTAGNFRFPKKGKGKPKPGIRGKTSEGGRGRGSEGLKARFGKGAKKRRGER